MPTQPQACRPQPIGKKGIDYRRWHHDKNLALCVVQYIGKMQQARTFCRAGFAQGQQAAQAPPGCAIFSVADQIRRIRQPQPAPDQQAQPRRLGGHMRPHHAGHAIDIRNADGRMAQGGGLFDEAFGMRSAFQKAERAGG